MRRVLSLLVMAMLFLLLGLGTQVQAEYNGPTIGGGVTTGGGDEGDEEGPDDGDGGHPWGGEQQSPEGGVVIKDRLSLTTETSFLLLDFLLDVFVDRKAGDYRYASTGYVSTKASDPAVSSEVREPAIRGQKYMGRVR